MKEIVWLGYNRFQIFLLFWIFKVTNNCTVISTLGSPWQFNIWWWTDIVTFSTKSRRFHGELSVPGKSQQNSNSCVVFSKNFEIEFQQKEKGTICFVIIYPHSCSHFHKTSTFSLFVIYLLEQLLTWGLGKLDKCFSLSFMIYHCCRYLFFIFGFPHF